MISPHIDRSEAIRLINEIGMADVWCIVAFSLEDFTFSIHSQIKPDDARVLVAAYVMNDEKLLNLIKEKL